MTTIKRRVRQYPVEFKIDAVKLVLEQGYSVREAATRLDIPANSLFSWKRQYAEGRLVPGYKRAQPTPEEAELKRLQAEAKRLAMENEILKKASSYFAKQLK